MRKITFILILLALTQFTGCATKRYYENNTSRSFHRYHRAYPVHYYDQYSNLSSPQVTPTVSETSYYYPNDRSLPNSASMSQNLTDYAQIIDLRRSNANVSGSSGASGNVGGAVVGAIFGGIIGNQLGRLDGNRNDHNDRRSRTHGNYSHNKNGNNRDAATIGGAIIGGLIGNEVGRTSNDATGTYQMTVRYPNGQTQTVQLDYSGNYQTGDWVRLRSQSGQWSID